MSNSKLEELATLIKESKQSTPYTVLLGSGLSITPTLLQALNCQDWSAFDAKMRSKSPNERYNLLHQLLNNLNQQEGYFCLARLLKDGYFNILLTANFDPNLEKALNTIGLTDDERDLLVQDEHSIKNIVDALTRPQPPIKVCMLCGRARGRTIPDVSVSETIEFDHQLSKKLKAYLEQDVIVLGASSRDINIHRCIPSRGGSLWYVTPESTPSDQWIIGLRRTRTGEVITGEAADFNYFFSHLVKLLDVKGSEPTKAGTMVVEILPEASQEQPQEVLQKPEQVSKQYVNSTQKTQVDRSSSLQNQQGIHTSSSSFSSEKEEVQQEIDHVQELIRIQKRNIDIVEEEIHKQGSSNIDLRFNKANLEEELEKYQNQLINLEARKKDLPVDKVPQIDVQDVEETPLAPQQRSHDGNTKPADSLPVYGTGKHWAVVVGVSDYEEGSPYRQLEVFNQLKTCDKDAEFFFERLLVRGFHPSRLALFTEQTLTPPDHKAILSRLQSTARATRPGDLLLFYYGGLVDEDDTDVYLVARDTAQRELQDTAVPVQEVMKILRSVSAKVLLLDIRHARAANASEDEKQHLNRCISRIREQAGEVSILAAYNERQSESRYSIFSSTLNETVTGLDDGNSSGPVTLRGVYQELKSNDKLFLVPVCVQDSVKLYLQRLQTPDSFLILAYLYIVKVHKTLEDVQAILTRLSTIYESTCRYLLEALYRMSDPPRPQTTHPTNIELHFLDRLSKAQRFVDSVIDHLLEIRSICDTSSAVTIIGYSHHILSDLANFLLKTNIIESELRNELIAADADRQSVKDLNDVETIV